MTIPSRPWPTTIPSLTLRNPREDVAALIKPSIAVDNAEQKRSKADQNSPDGDQRHLISGIEEASNDGRKDEDEERLRGANEVEVVAVSVSSVNAPNRCYPQLLRGWRAAAMAGKGVALVRMAQLNVHLSARHEMLHIVAGICAIGIDLDYRQRHTSTSTPFSTHETPGVEHQKEAPKETGIGTPPGRPRRLVRVGVLRILGDGKRGERVSATGGRWAARHLFVVVNGCVDLNGWRFGGGDAAVAVGSRGGRRGRVFGRG